MVASLVVLQFIVLKDEIVRMHGSIEADAFHHSPQIYLAEISKRL